MATGTPKMPQSAIDEFMNTCKSEADDSQRCRQIIGQLTAEVEDYKKALDEIYRWWPITIPEIKILAGKALKGVKMSNKSIEISENKIVKTFDKMCQESLSPEVYSVWADEIWPTLSCVRTQLGTPNELVFLDSQKTTFYCQTCEKHQPISFANANDTKTGMLYTDILCKKCMFILATIEE